MGDIYSNIVDMFKQNRVFVLATIIRQTGSSPRGPGTKFLIMEDGSHVGTIGGGLVESRVLEGAGEVLDARAPRRLFFTMTGVDVAETDMLCGGDVDIFMEPVYPENTVDVSIFKRIAEIVRRGGAGVLATIVEEDRWTGRATPRLFLGSGGERIGAFPGLSEAEDAIASQMDRIMAGGKPEVFTVTDKAGKRVELFVEPLISAPVLYIFGGGHVSSQIVPLADKVGFRVTVIDDRPEFADPLRFPQAKDVRQFSFEGVLDRLPVDDASYLVIVTRGHLHDLVVLRQALRSRARYIGMIGSRRKRDIIYQKLLEEGFGPEDLARVHSPVGLNIGAETPEEIAVSIVGELISVRAGIEGKEA